MSNQFYWAHDPTAVVTSFTVKRSVDGGVTWTTLATIAYDTSGANYEPKTRRWTYTDVSGDAGYVYSVSASGEFGTSKEALVVAPPNTPSLCTVIGYILDPFGQADINLRVLVEAYGSVGERWIKSPGGVIGNNSEALGLRRSTRIVYPNSSGLWQVDLVQGCLARVHIPDMEFSWAFRTPEKLGPVNIRDIEQLRGADSALFGEANGDRFQLPES